MKITLHSKWSLSIVGPFAAYEYQECFAAKPGYIDVRGIVRRKADAWFDELQNSHQNVAAVFLKHTHWWWITPYSRLDVRPWGQEEIVKPMLFARALAVWQQENDTEVEISLVACHPLVLLFLKEFIPTAQVSLVSRGKAFAHLFFFLMREMGKVMMRLFVDGIRIMRHVFTLRRYVGGRCLVLFESNPEASVSEDIKYYFGSLFSSKDELRKSNTVIATVARSYHNVKALRDQIAEHEGGVLLPDGISLQSVVYFSFVNLKLIFISLLMIFERSRLVIEKKTSTLFWSTYIVYQLGKCCGLYEMCIYEILRKIFKRGVVKQVVYPYEEKSIERAILFACKEFNVKSIGYTPNPQHRYALALRDGFTPSPLRPTQYAVSGPAYINYFVAWAKKDPKDIILWGSGRWPRGSFSFRKPEAKLCTLLLISHPKELLVFRSWLECVPQLCSVSNYRIRLYKSVEYAAQKKILCDMQRNFPVCREGSSDLTEDLKESDLVLFSATSAGLTAALQGRLALHIYLGEFLQINPCFDRTQEFLPCTTAHELLTCIESLRGLHQDQLRLLHQKQNDIADSIYSETTSSPLSCHAAAI